MGQARATAVWLSVAAPLVWLPGGLVAFVLPKLLLTALAGLVAALARPVGRLPRSLVVVGAVWAAVFALAALLGDAPLTSLAGRWPRFEGLPVLGLYALAGWTGARVITPDADGAHRLRVAVGTSGLVLAAFTALDLIGVSPLPATGGDRSGSLLGNATDQGAVAMAVALVVAGPVLAGRWGEWRRGDLAFHLAALAGALGTVAASGSRTALALTAVGLVVSSRRPLRGAAGVAGLALAAVALPATRERLLDGASGEGRLEQWRLTLGLVREHLWLGVGGSRYLEVFGAHESASFVRFTGAARPADSPHSVLLQVLVAGGLVLAAVTVVGVVLAARRAVVVARERPEVRPALLAAVASMLLLCVNFTAAGPTCLAAFLLGTVIAVPARAQTRPRALAGAEPGSDGDAAAGARPADAVVAVAAVAAALLVASASVAEVRLEQAVSAAQSHDVPRAVDAVAAAERWRPWDPDVGVIGGRALAEEASLGGEDADLAAREAEAALTRALAHAPDDALALVALGVARLSLGDLEGALSVLDEAVAAAPERPDAYVQRAIAHVGLGDLDLARADLARAAEITPRSPVVRRLQEQRGLQEQVGPG